MFFNIGEIYPVKALSIPLSAFAKIGADFRVIRGKGPVFAVGGMSSIVEVEIMNQKIFTNVCLNRPKSRAFLAKFMKGSFLFTYLFV